MEVFSLEEDEDVSQLFITQESKGETHEDSILGDQMDFQSPCVGLTSQTNATTGVYEDISDDDFQPFPCSQMDTSEVKDYEE